MIDFLEDKKGIVADVIGMEDMLSVTGFVGEGNERKYFRVDVSTKIEDKRRFLEMFCQELKQALKEIEESNV